MFSFFSFIISHLLHQKIFNALLLCIFIIWATPLQIIFVWVFCIVSILDFAYHLSKNTKVLCGVYETDIYTCTLCKLCHIEIYMQETIHNLLFVWGHHANWWLLREMCLLLTCGSIQFMQSWISASRGTSITVSVLYNRNCFLRSPLRAAKTNLKKQVVCEVKVVKTCSCKAANM